jgi:hypothetical protein
MRHAIKLIGIELEGGWEEEPENGVNGESHSDGSVNSFSGCQYDGEFVSRPMPLYDVESWIFRNYPDSMDSSCGLHVHMSLKTNLQYSRLMSKEFYDYFYRKLKIWGEKKKVYKDSSFWKRLEGRNTYCRVEYRDPDEQARSVSKGQYGDRYNMLNFCYGTHGTLECRVLPVFKSKGLAVSAIMTVCHIVETYLRKPWAAEPEKKVVVEDDEDDTEKQHEVIIPDRDGPSDFSVVINPETGDTCA